jgi:hypothetical protein
MEPIFCSGCGLKIRYADDDHGAHYCGLCKEKILRGEKIQSLMRRICAWCNRVLFDGVRGNKNITHGICKKCMKKMLDNNG